MSYSHTISETTTFSVTHARHMAAKVATDLKRMQRFYGKPSDTDIANYEKEAIELLKAGYLWTVTYGFKRNGEWIEPTLRYTARNLYGSIADDNDPGRVRPNADIDGASFYSYLKYSNSWFKLPDKDKEFFEEKLPFKRGTADEPGVNGYFNNDRIYSAGGRALDRASVRSLL